MSELVAKKIRSGIKVVDATKVTPIAKPSDQISKRASKELVLAFSGPLGCGISSVIDETESILVTANYRVERIKVSNFIEESLARGIIEIDESTFQGKMERYVRLQNAGNALRRKFATPDVLAEFAIKEIADRRTSKIPENNGLLTSYVPERVAYLLDQLKNDAEVNLLRAVYGNLFYLFGVISVDNKRKARLLAEDISESEVGSLMERDRKEVDESGKSDKFGQQLESALQLADFFIRNDHPNSDSLKHQIMRLIDLIHGVNGVSPTTHEYGMYVAYAAGMRSSCLSRQIGASILNKSGDVIATGRNDVPKPGGGLYTPESLMNDARCVKLEGKKCFNDFHKSLLRDKIKCILEQELEAKIKDILDQELNTLSIDSIKLRENSEILADKICSSSRIKSLIEFSRAIHAEMDAIISVAREGESGLAGCTLYTTTFPCHSCARHIIAAGIKDVFYIEPYEKSLASDLHNDAIAFDPDETTPKSETSKVRFIHFEGVAPKQYLNLFSAKNDRKDGSGKAIIEPVSKSEKTVHAYLDSYRDYESKVVEHLVQITGASDSG